MNPLSEQQGYVLRDRHPERHEIYEKLDFLSAAARRTPGYLGAFGYGPHEREQFDLFLADAPDAPLVVFFHGGYWQSLDRSRFSFIGEQLRRQGVSVALPSYPLCPEYRLEEVLRSAAASIPAVLKKLEQLGRSPKEWSIAGHSAGGHIAAWIAANGDWPGVTGPSRCCAISGIFDLQPLLHTTLNEALRLEPAAARKLSLDPVGAAKTRLRLAVGADETDAFLRQSRLFLSSVSSAGGHVTLEELDGYSHYTVLTEFLRPVSRLGQMVLGGATASVKD